MGDTIKIILIILSILVGLYLILNVVIAILTLPLINKPKRRTRDWQKEYFASISNAYKNNKLDRNPIKFIMKDGYEINGDYTIRDPKKFVILAHGHTSTREGMITHASIFDKYGYSTVVFDQRGHGDNVKVNVTMGYQERLDLNEIIDQVRDKFGKDIEISLCGVSMGGDCVLQMTRYRDSKDIKFIVCDCGYYSVDHVIKHCLKIRHLNIFIFSFILIKLFTNIFYHYTYKDINCFDSVVKSDIPILFILGDNDPTVPYTESVDLNKARPDTKISIYSGIRHARCIFDEYDRYEKDIKEYIEQFI